jgi:hypothetical protein
MFLSVNGTAEILWHRSQFVQIALDAWLEPRMDKFERVG